MRGMRAGTWLTALLALTTALGCSSGPGGKLSLFPDGHRLIPPAREIRDETQPPVGVPRELEKQLAGPYIVEPGDVLLVQPASLDSPIRLPGDQVVLPDGTIQLGRYGRVNVAGKALDQIESEINAHINGITSNAGPIIVRIVTRESKEFYVLGEVNAPGAFPLRGRETVLNAILVAGGLNNNASRRKIILVRPTAPNSCRVILPVDWYAIAQLGDTTTNYQIRAGDRVYVPSSSMWENCFGAFHNPHYKEHTGCPAGEGCATCAARVPSDRRVVRHMVDANSEVPAPTEVPGRRFEAPGLFAPERRADLYPAAAADQEAEAPMYPGARSWAPPQPTPTMAPPMASQVPAPMAPMAPPPVPQPALQPSAPVVPVVPGGPRTISPGTFPGGSSYGQPLISPPANTPQGGGRLGPAASLAHPAPLASTNMTTPGPLPHLPVEPTAGVTVWRGVSSSSRQP